MRTFVHPFAVIGFATVAIVTSYAAGESANSGPAAVQHRPWRLDLGSVDFPTTGSPEAKARFHNGLAALHSFWYELALAEFEAATRAEPGFAMGYWGQAMSHNRTLWGEQETQAARRALAAVTDTANLTERERAYLDATRALYGEGDKLARDLAYMEAMRDLARAYPDDLEAGALYALSILGTVRPGDPGFDRQLRAGAIAEEVLARKPRHPGAAHYVLHAYDRPQHARRALAAARRYAEIAPAAPHALHMPSHIFLQLGMWPEAAASNEAAWQAAIEWMQRGGPGSEPRDSFHSLSWLNYIYLQQGRWSDARRVLQTARQMANRADSERLRRIHLGLAATFLVETQAWGEAAELLGPPSSRDASLTSVLWARGLAAAEQGDRATVEAALKAVGTVRERLVAEARQFEAMGVEIMRLGLAARMYASAGNVEEASRLMLLATGLEERMSPPEGPPRVLKPSHELFGEILLEAGRPESAIRQFVTSLVRHPNRPRSLLGTARSAVAIGDEQAARDAYSDFVRAWSSADQDLPELHEALAYLERTVNP